VGGSFVFVNDRHLELFDVLVDKAEARPTEFDYLAALYLLACPLLSSKNVSKHVGPREIKFGAMLEEAKPWSSGERALITLAVGLFNPQNPCMLDNVFRSLDHENGSIALEAIRIRYVP
jgi:hypothetical protein